MAWWPFVRRAQGFAALDLTYVKLTFPVHGDTSATYVILRRRRVDRVSKARPEVGHSCKAVMETTVMVPGAGVPATHTARRPSRVSFFNTKQVLSPMGKLTANDSLANARAMYRATKRMRKIGRAVLTFSDSAQGGHRQTGNSDSALNTL